MTQYINKCALVSEIDKRIKQYEKAFDSPSPSFASYEASLIAKGKYRKLLDILQFINALEVKEVDLELENENNNPKITIGTKIRSKTNPYVILSIISDDCHEDEYECSNGSVLSLKQIEKYYEII